MHALRVLRQLVCAVVVVLLVARGGSAAAQDLQGARAATVSLRELAVPKEARDHLERAKRAARSKKEELFEREVQVAIALYPPFLEAYLLLADRENGAGRVDAAIENARKAQAIDSESMTARILLASAYNSKRQYVDALAMLSTVRGAEASSWQAKYETARAHVGLSHASEALQWSRSALEAAPPSCVDAHVLMADAYQLNRQWRQASQELEAYLASHQPLLHEQVVREVLERTRELAERGQVSASQPTASTLAQPPEITRAAVR